MGDTFTKTTSQSWFGRLGGSIKGILVGIVLIIGAVPFLFWNEGRAVETYKTLLEGAGLVIAADSASVDPANEGKLVHVTGLATTNETISDPALNVAVAAIRLLRDVEMYQWIERTESITREKLGGGTEAVTTYRYEKGWSENLIDSNRFEHPADHSNPQTMPVRSDRWQARNVALGAYRLSASLIGSIGGDEQHFLGSEISVPSNLGANAKLHQGGFYVGDPSSPQIGNLRIAYRIVMPAEVSIIARQVKNSFEPFKASAGGTIQMLEMGTRSAEAMFDEAQARNTTLTWILRAVGFVIMMIGFRMIFSILRVAASVVPMVGQIVGVGVNLVSGVLAASLALVTIAVAWVYYRPLLGIALLIAAAGLVYFIYARVRGAKVVIEEPNPQDQDSGLSNTSVSKPETPPVSSNW